MTPAYSASLNIFLHIPVFRPELTIHHMEKSDHRLAGLFQQELSSVTECFPAMLFCSQLEDFVIVIQITVSEVQLHLYTVLSELSL